jgi:hypothetical protein
MGVFVHLMNSCIPMVLCRDAAHYSRREERGGLHGNFHFTFYIAAKRKRVVVFLSLDSY